MSLAVEKALPSTRIAGVFASGLAAGRLPIGTLFAGRYEIQSVLGVGGTGIVYEAYDRELDDLVAIKTLRWDPLSENSPLLDRFKQEVRLARRITHPNVLRTYDFGESNGLRFISMELVKGMTLKHLLETATIVPTATGLRIAKQMCAGLAAAHEVGVIHRDVKSQNVIIEPTGRLKIMDFGTARVIEDRRATSTIIGTPDYMSPEQVRGDFLDHRTDVYSTGVVLYELFTGSLPFEGDSPLEVVLKHVHDDVPLPQSRNPWIEPRIAAVLRKCLEKEPDARFQSMDELSEALTKTTARQAA